MQVPRGTPALTRLARAVPGDSTEAGPRHPTRAVSLGRVLLVAATVVVVDQLTKAWAVAALSNHPRHVIGTVDLELARNPGGAFSTFTRATPVLAVVAVALTFMLVRLVRRATDPATAIALALVLGGAVGNLVDRVVRTPGFLRGHVVDFIKAVSWWPTFNVADMAITIGAVLLIIRGWRTEPQR
jgi:signal peptidase II